MSLFNYVLFINGGALVPYLLYCIFLTIFL